MPIEEAHGRAFVARLEAACEALLVVEPGAERLVAHAVKSFGAPPIETVRTHTGWLQDPQGAWHFLDNQKDVLWTDAGRERPPVRVLLPNRSILPRYRLRQGLDPAKGWEAFQMCLDAAVRSVTLPLFSCAVLPAVHRFLGRAR